MIQMCNIKVVIDCSKISSKSASVVAHNTIPIRRLLLLHPLGDANLLLLPLLLLVLPFTWIRSTATIPGHHQYVLTPI